MINYAWHDVVPTDSAVQRGEWAGVRPSTAAERKAVEATRAQTCNTFLFAACGGFLRLVVAQDTPKPSFLKRVTMAGAIRKALAGKTHEVDQTFSCSVLGTAIALVPCMADELRAVADRRRCENCTCILRIGGPIDPDSPQRRFIAAELEGSKFMKRTEK